MLDPAKALRAFLGLAKSNVAQAWALSVLGA